MKLLHSYRVGGEAGLPDETQLAVYAGLAAGLGRPDWPVDVAWVEDLEMAALNSRFRDVDGVTDVLSFGNLETDGGEPPPDLAGGESAAFCDLYRDVLDAEAGAVVGEIVIAPDFVRRRCLQNGWNHADELNLLVVHGLLHLLGWDHEEPVQAQRMRELETTILETAGLPHPLAGQ